MEDEKITAAKAFRFLSPLMLVSIYSVIVVIGSIFEHDKSGGWSMIGVIIFLPILAVAIVIDFFIKLFVKDNILQLWIIEILITLIGGGIFYYCFF